MMTTHQRLGLSLTILSTLLVTTAGASDDLQLTITSHSPVTGESSSSGVITLREGSVLNISCEASVESVELSWYLPNTHLVTQTRFHQSGGAGVSHLIISPLETSDAGVYQCWGVTTGAVTTIKQVLRLIVETRHGQCPPGQFQCKSEEKQICIATRYRCDSFPDCPGGDDESDSLCGYDPCKGKIRCPELDSRCIDPSEYCCDPHTHPDTCPFLYPCCESVIEFSIRSRLSQQWDSDLSRDNDAETLTTLHSTIYIIIGCLIAFLLIMLCLGVAVYRLHIVRKLQTRGRGAGRPHPPITLHDLDVYFSDRAGGDYHQVGGGQHITYNINHGVQIVGAPQHPPPYDPPPPYEQELGEDDNNNGDINGNSDMVDNNVVQENNARAEAPPVYPRQDYSSDSSDTE